MRLLVTIAVVVAFMGQATAQTKTIGVSLASDTFVFYTQLRKGMDQLPSNDREILTLRYALDYNTEVIAEMLVTQSATQGEAVQRPPVLGVEGHERLLL